MDLSNLQPAEGSIKERKRIGRGQGSTRGGTSTRGHKGAKSRSGYKRKAGFEGGQMPLFRRVPKFGFKNINRVEYQAVNIDSLQRLATEKGITTFTQDVLIENGLVNKNGNKVKILGRGELTSKIEVTAHAYTKTAQKAIEEQGGTANTI
ncbi:MAG: 50S ribosomal protein L15 [Bacteroidales bacterium]|nr:50S ribosomal protein L15 [Bacteroidales bacterium]RLD39294.1 MAG: 50S ribosomal protein L15 [Bacteroidota bacterium]